MTPITYLSTDSGAPSLTGQANTLANLLRTILCGNGSGVAYGSGGSQKNAAGWSLPFTPSGNQIVLRNNPSGGTGMYLRILDDGSGAAGYKQAHAWVYSSMSALATGSNQCPASATLSTGVPWKKSTTADGTNRAWACVADNRSFWLEVASGTYYAVYYCGDFNSEIAGDAYAYCIAGESVDNDFNNGNDIYLTPSYTFNPSIKTGLYIPMGYNQTSPIDIIGSLILAGGSQSGQTNYNIGIGGYYASFGAPSAGNNNYYFCPPILGAQGILRGKLRGAYLPMNDLRTYAASANTRIIGATGMPSGSNLLCMRAGSGRANIDSVICVETGAAW